MFVTHPEERSFKDEQMAVADQVREKLEKEGQQEQADVHAVDVGIGTDHHLVESRPRYPGHAAAG